MIVLAAAALAPACNKEAPQVEAKEQAVEAKEPVAEAKPVVVSPAAEAKKTFKTRCAMCHGESGVGDGAAAKALTVKPRNFSDKEWQTATTDQQIKDIIVKGGAGVGKDPGMPAGADLGAKPEVLDELVKKIRAFGG